MFRIGRTRLFLALDSISLLRLLLPFSRVLQGELVALGGRVAHLAGSAFGDRCGFACGHTTILKYGRQYFLCERLNFACELLIISHFRAVSQHLSKVLIQWRTLSETRINDCSTEESTNMKRPRIAILIDSNSGPFLKQNALRLQCRAPQCGEWPRDNSDHHHAFYAICFAVSLQPGQSFRDAPVRRVRAAPIQ